MQITDSFHLNSPPETVWEILFDIPLLAKCIPGVENVEMIDEKTYRGKLQVKVGPIKSEFFGTVTLKEITPPNFLAGAVDGDDKGSASAVKATFSVSLVEVEQGTQVSFVIDANIRGRLAQFGGPVIQATSKKMTAEFSKNLRAALEI